MDDAMKHTDELPDNWQALQIVGLFRFCLGVTLFLLMQLGPGTTSLGFIQPVFFLITVECYIGLSVLSLIGAISKRPDYFLQANVPIFFDIFCVVLLTHFSGGIITGLGLLLVVVVAAHTLLTSSLYAYGGAAVATSCLLGEQLYSHFSSSVVEPAFMQAGILGFCIFVTVMVCTWLRHRLVRMQRLALIRGTKLETSLRLNTQVVSHMQEGVLVIDHERSITLINSAALRLLGLFDQHPTHCNDLPLRFSQALDAWLTTMTKSEPIQLVKGAAKIQISGEVLGEGDHQHWVVFLHDLGKEAQQAQHMKLALLGNLAANIAHEIRNPLSAVSHAAQILEESVDSSTQQGQLLAIIQENSSRMNTVIKNVLSLSKKEPINPTVLNLREYLETFVCEFSPSNIQDVMIELEFVSPEELLIFIDPSQLRQVMVNLCENGLRYSLRYVHEAKVKIEVNIESHHVVIHIIDYGQGIETQHRDHIFEPFYTTESHGSGLGLYITREICQMHHGDIQLLGTEHGGCCFQIKLPLASEANYERA